MEYSPLHSLCESITDCPHSTPEWTTSGKVVIRNQNIKNGKLDLSSPSYTTTHDFQRRIIRAKPASGDIIITREAPMGEACLVPEGLECCLGQRMVLLKPDDKKCNNKYLLYAILSPYVQHQISWSFGTGTTVSNLRIPHLETLKIPCPDRNVQDSIAATLSSLDDKIELNNRIIANLEAQSQAIFKSWFVDFEPFQDGGFDESELGLIPKGWRVGTLDELIDIRYGKDHKKLGDGSIPVYGSGGIMRYADQSIYSGESVLIPRKGTLSNVLYVTDQFWTVDTMFYTIMRKNNIAKFVYLFVLGLDLASMNSGSAVPSMTTNILNAIQLVMPEDEALESFETVVSPMYRAIKQIEKQNDKLAQLRDALLPKLMSGEIEVPVKG